MKTHLLSLLLCSAFTVALMAQEPDTESTSSDKKVKTGFSLGGVPVVAYDSDIGFKYGALVNLY